jgi:AcrR family transcriptional regulator
MGKREEQREARRAAILAAGLQLVLDEGYERTSVERITSSVGIARGTFYLYFEDKEALFRALADALYQPLVSVLEETAVALRAAPDIGTQQLLYLQMSARLASVVEDNQYGVTLHFRERRSAGASGRIVAEWMARIEDLGRQMLEDAAERGLIRGIDAYTVALSIVGATERLLWAWAEGDEKLNADSAALQLANVFFGGISA